MARMARVAAPACPPGLSGGPAARHHAARHQDGRVNCGNRWAEVFWADAGLWLLAFHSALRNPQCFSPFLIPGRRPPSAVLAVLSPRSLPASGGFLSPFSSTFFPHWHGSCAQRRMAMRPCCKPSNSCQNRSKRRRFPSKSDQKRAHFVMPILTFWGVTPSGASARAVLAFPKGKKGAFSGAPGRVPKLSTISWRLWITPGFLFAP